MYVKAPENIKQHIIVFTNPVFLNTIISVKVIKINTTITIKLRVSNFIKIEISDIVGIKFRVIQACANILKVNR
ncbi:hypothetical protein [Paraclostridium sordellii]|uniref:hypothetical protein n=1 Tax=Paraclostridium sordellii TaxID=1505 RepID=UPI0007092947|nr:hypothetical protein [Paeniclostridium sordellii]